MLCGQQGALLTTVSLWPDLINVRQTLNTEIMIHMCKGIQKEGAALLLFGIQNLNKVVNQNNKVHSG